MTDSKNIINLGHDEDLQVKHVADIVVDEMGLSNVEYVYSGGIRGWKGDSPFVLLDTTKCKKTGWKPIVPTEKSIRKTVKYLLKHLSDIKR